MTRTTRSTWAILDGNQMRGEQESAKNDGKANKDNHQEKVNRDEDRDDNNAPATVTPVRKKQKRSGGCGPTISADCGAPRDKHKTKLFYQFLWFRATQRRRMYPQETVVGSGAELPPAELPTAGQGGWGFGPNLMRVAKWGNIGRYLDSGDRVTGDFVRAKLEHLGLALESPEGIAAALSMCVVEMDAWRVDFLRRWTAQTPGDWFRMAKGQMKGLNLPAGREEVKNFVSFARRVMRNEDGPFFSGSYQVQGRRLVDSTPSSKGRYYDERLGQIDGVVAALGAAKTWEDACRAVMQLGGCGPFVGGQALLTFLYGVCADDVSRFAPSLDAGTMIDYCTYGGGPKRMVERLWRVPGESVRLREHEVVARISWLAKNAEAEFAQLGFAFPYQLWKGTKRRRALTAVDMEHSLCYFSRYLAGYEGLKEAGTATVHRMLSGPVAKKDCPRPSIKWVASLTAHTAAGRCRKWLGGEEVDDESDPDE